MDFIIKRAAMTECGDYYDYSCDGWSVEVTDAEGNVSYNEGDCDHSAGCNGPDPYIVSDGAVYCGYCAFKEATLEGSGITFDFDPETTYEDDTIYGIISDLLWGRGYLNGMEAHQATEEYKTNLAKFRDGTWDEATNGPFWKWSDENMFPFLVAAKVAIVEELKGLVDTKIAAMDVTRDEDGDFDQMGGPNDWEDADKDEDPEIAFGQYKALSCAFQEMMESSKDLKQVSRADAAMDMLKRQGWEESK
ncbi:MAG TPA: hypothetical protein EYO31_01990 [Phycisphaerales bacterium]|nr:hypothetical protein [Phycisphaerales bacterium]